MTSRYTYSKTIWNNYLNKQKEVKASTLYELEQKCNSQFEIWNRQEASQRAREAVADLKAEAEEMNDDIQELQDEYASILKSSICKNERLFNWDSYISKDKFKDFIFKKEVPNLQELYFQRNIPKQSFFENIFKSMKIRREALERQTKDEYEQLLSTYENEKSKAHKKWLREKEIFEAEQKKNNQEITIWREEFEKGIPSAIESYFEDALEESLYPEDFPQNIAAQYDSAGKILVVSVQLPNTDNVTRTKGFKYVASTKTIKPIEMSEKDFNNLYDNIVKQIALRTIHEVFSEDYTQNVESVVFNGWIDSINKANGQAFTACIISIQVSRDKFSLINLERVNPSDCIRDLKGVFAGNLAQLAPVKPILNIDRNDSRFIESKDIAASLKEGDNLAEMSWEDFEHLVRELFSKYFSEAGSEVKVTQSSRDGGVDAIAFDPDPIRGGKFVIQAKRYNRVVPVSAVRDLYGTMINEGAAKGILVTTSYYGNDSREFVKDKPISLIDGSNLVHMLGEYGFNAYIELK